MSFDFIPASSQYLISAAGSAPINTGTITAWCAPDFLASTTTAYTFWSAATGDVRLQKDTTTMSLTAIVDGRTGTYTIPTSWTASTWHHFAMRYNKTEIDGWPADNIDIFIDGVKLVGAAKSGSWGANTPGILHIGSLATPGTYFDGKIAEVATYNKILSDQQIGALASGKNPVTVAPDYLINYWPLTSALVRYPRIGNIYLALGATPLVNDSHPSVVSPPQFYDLENPRTGGCIRYVPPWTLGLEAFNLKATATTRHLSNLILVCGYSKFRLRTRHCGLTAGTVGALALDAKLFPPDKSTYLASGEWVNLSTAHATTAITGYSSVSFGEYAPTAIGCTIHAAANSLRFGPYLQVGAYITTASDLATGVGAVSLEMSK